jgi:hypothetical protein
MIRSLTVIGHGTNLLTHHIEHYSNYVDEICYVVYNTDNNPKLHDEVNEIVKNYKNVKIVKTHYDRVFDWERVTMLYNYVTKKEPNNWWVISDIDEFHLYPNDNLKQCIEDCDKNGWQLMRGGFIDRIGENGEFSELETSRNIFEQFPNMGFFRYPMSNACPNKICVMKGHVEITSGQHYAKIDGYTTWRWQGWNHPLIAPIESHSVQVHHFKWDKSSIERLKSVANINQEYAFSEEYRKMYKEISKTKNRINLGEPEFMFEQNGKPNFSEYKQWNKLIKKIVSI